MTRARRLFTPANVIACVALFVALGGTGWAGQVIGHGSVGSVQLKSNAVTASKIANGAVTKTKLAPGLIALVPANSLGTVVNAVCPAGAKAVSGGWSSGLYAVPISEAPTPDGAGWTVSFQGFSSPSSVTVSVICIAP